MNFDRDQHLRWVANFFSSKVAEHHHYLEEIVSQCDLSLAHAMAGTQQPENLYKIVVYRFSAYLNTVMTLRDAGSEFLVEVIETADLTGLRHGAFIFDARNAATHDGNPIISAWADGKFFVPEDIVRPSQNKNKTISLVRPSIDLRTFCLEYSADLAAMFIRKLKGGTNVAELDRALYVEENVRQFMRSDFVPHEARKIFAENLDQFREALLRAPRIHPLQMAAERLQRLIEYTKIASNSR